MRSWKNQSFLVFRTRVSLNSEVSEYKLWGETWLSHAHAFSFLPVKNCSHHHWKRAPERSHCASPWKNAPESGAGRNKLGPRAAGGSRRPHPCAALRQRHRSNLTLEQKPKSNAISKNELILEKKKKKTPKMI